MTKQDNSKRNVCCRNLRLTEYDHTHILIPVEPHRHTSILMSSATKVKAEDTSYGDRPILCDEGEHCSSHVNALLRTPAGRDGSSCCSLSPPHSYSMILFPQAALSQWLRMTEPLRQCDSCKDAGFFWWVTLAPTGLAKTLLVQRS